MLRALFLLGGLGMVYGSIEYGADKTSYIGGIITGIMFMWATSGPKLGG